VSSRLGHAWARQSEDGGPRPLEALPALGAAKGEGDKGRSSPAPLALFGSVEEVRNHD
jgi:hypothetical protein